MKRITFIEPVASMQGKLSANRKLTYPTRDNSAWDAPTGKSYATNYRPSYIGNLRKKDGVTYFGTKVRSSVTMNAETRLTQALLGASVSITSSMLKNPQIFSIVQTAYLINQPEGQTLNKWCQSQVRIFLEEQSDFWFIGNSGMNYIQNPYISTHHDPSIAITGLNDEILVKFWNQLASNPITFSVNSQKGVAHTGDSFAALTESTYNTLDLTLTAGSGFQYVKKGDMFVCFTASNGESYAAAHSRAILEQDQTAGAEPSSKFFLSPTALPFMDD